MDEDKKAGLRAQLDAHHDWPAEYMFKFIAPNQADRICLLYTSDAADE